MIQILTLIVFSLLSQIFCGPPKPNSPPISDTEQTTRSLTSILSDLKSDNWNTRSLALAELSNLGYREAIPEVRKMLNDPSPIVKGSAAICLGEFQDKASLDPIIGLFSDKEIPREVLVDALKRMKDPRGGKSILPFLNSEDSTLRLLVVDALFGMNARSLGKDILMMATKNKDPEKDKTFAMALGKLEVREAEDYLIQIAGREKESPTLAATLLAMGRIKSKKSIPVLAQALGGVFPKGRENASISLKSIKDKSSLPLLYPFLRNPDPEIRYLSAEVISEIPDPETTKVIETILNTKMEIFYGASCLLAGQLRLKEHRNRIEEILQDKNVPEREIVAQSLGWMGEKASVPILISVLEESQGEGRYGAAWALGILEARESISVLQKAANSPDQKLSNLAIESIGHLKMEESIEFLESILKKDQNKSVFVISSIAGVPGEKANLVLLKYASLEEPILYRPAIEFLGQRKDKKTAKPLLEILKQGNSDKSRIIVSALNSITGRKIRSTSEWLTQDLE